MFGWLSEKIVQGYQLRQLNRNPVVRLGRDVIRQGWVGNREATAGLSDKFVKEQAAQMMTEVIKIATSLNPKLANRLILTECVSEFSKFAVLIIDPPPTEDPMGFLGRPGITGELKAHLLELTKKSENLKTYLANFGNVEKWDDVWAAVYGRYQQTNVWMNVFQAMRVEFNDSSLGKIGAVKDWFRPFVEAMCAWQESQYRQDLGLSPSLMVAGDATRTSSGMLALAYGGFMNDVLDGAPDPYMTWMKKMDELGLRARGSLR